MKPVLFDPKARTEFEAAVEYYERKRPRLGREFQAEIERACAEIRRFPKR